MQPTSTRRSVLAAAVSLSVTAGCNAKTESVTTTTRTTTTVAAPPPPSRDLPVLTRDTIEFRGDVTFPEAGVYGWVFDGTFTRSLRVTAKVRDGPSATVYVTNEQVEEPQVPGSTTKEWEAPIDRVGASLEGGNGSLLIRTRGETTIYLAFEAETI